MKDGLRAGGLHRLEHVAEVADVAADQRHPVRNVRQAPLRAADVEHGDLVAAFRNQLAHDFGADEAGAAGDQYPHGVSPVSLSL